MLSVYQAISKIPATESNRPTNDLDLIYDLLDALNSPHGFLGQLRVKETVQATPKHEHSVVVLAKHFLEGLV